MNLQEIVKILIDSGIEPIEAKRELKILLEHYCNYTAKDIIMERPLDYAKLKIIEEKAKYRANTHEPIQYIIGEAYFMNNYYKVTPDVLIPRDETEIVVLTAINLIKQNHLTKILEIGTGSGCIACTIAQKTGLPIVATDISEKALQIAKINSQKLELDNMQFLKSDLFSEITSKFDLIVSNPPYIPMNTTLQQEVTFEPELALYTNDSDGIEFYKKIIEESLNYLNSNGFIVFELGINQSELVKNIFKQNNFTNISIVKDLAGIDRVITAQKN